MNGPYRAPRLQSGARATCYYRDGDVVITTWTDARISWPKCRRLHGKDGNHGLLVNDELARAVRTEAAVAVVYWWGVSHHSVSQWRKSLDVTYWSNRGTQRANRNAIDIANEVWHDLAKNTPRGRAIMRRRTIHMLGDRGKIWSKKELRLLGTLSDKEVAQRVGRSYNAVQRLRLQRGIECLGPKKERWTQQEDAIVRNQSIDFAVKNTGRTRKAVLQRRKTLRIVEVDWWTEKEIKLLGTKPDDQLARRFGRMESAVRGKREALGIEKFGSQNRAWTKQEDAIVRAMPSLKAAERTGRSLTAIYSRRAQLGIQGKSPQRWIKKHLELLGTMPDKELAAKIGRPTVAVAIKRRLLGIPRLGGQNPRWTSSEDDLVRKFSVAEVVAQTGRSPMSVRYRRQKLGIAETLKWTHREKALIGTMPDVKVAKRIGRDVSAVRRMREKLHIHKPDSRSRPWTIPEDEIVQKLAVDEAVKATGRTLIAVTGRRKYLRRIQASKERVPISGEASVAAGSEDSSNGSAD